MTNSQIFNDTTINKATKRFKEMFSGFYNLTDRKNF